MKTFKTPKGTELELMNLKGKDYLQIQQRLIWFVEENPRYDITTDFVRITDEEVVARCTVSVLEDTSQGVRVVKKVTDYKTENAKSFPDFVEKACSGSMGRCLSLLGYGTQFASADLDEGVRLADSPVTPKETPTKVTLTGPSVTVEVKASTPAEPSVKTLPMAIPASTAKANKFARSKPSPGSL